MVDEALEQMNFNPRSREGSDYSAEEAVKVIEISIHAPARGATILEPTNIQRHVKFQSTLPRGERRSGRVCYNKTTGISIHAPARGATL